MKVSKSLLENAITLLAYDDVNGRAVAQLVDPKLFEGEFRIIAERAIAFWEEHGEAPKNHLVDELADVLDKQDGTAESVSLILSQMYELWQAGINGPYIVGKLSMLVQVQTMKAEIIRVADILHEGGELKLSEAHEVLDGLRRARHTDMTRGLSLANYYEYAENLAVSTEDAISLGIPPLDEAFIMLERQTLTVFIAPTNAGKSWFLTHCGWRALERRRKVLHVTLELRAFPTLGRYYQTMFSVPKRVGEELVHELVVRNRKLDDIVTTVADPDFTLDRDTHLVSAELEAHLRQIGGKINNLEVKKFPMSTLTVGHLDAYMDFLEVDGFIPDLLIIDYPKLMKLDARNLRIDLGRTFEEIHEICERRNVAGVVVHQASKEGAKAPNVRMTHVSEDWSVVQTADNVLTYSATETEQALGLARIFVNKARSEKARFQVLISQAYGIGQFCVSAHRMPDNYSDYLRANPATDAEEDQEGEENDEERFEQGIQGRAGRNQFARRRGGF
jgi:hypothetical protein